MKNASITATILVLIFFTGCRSTESVIIPLSRSIELDDTYTIIWNGVSKAHRFENGQWHRAEKYDYQFDVVQKRKSERWESVKSLHRLHPEYDGKAGARDQTMYFQVAYNNLTDGKVHSTISSSLGSGTGTSDIEFRNSVFTMYVANAGRFKPYNKLRITQHYNYEAGVLTETVELIREKDGEEIPFMKNEETATIYVKGKLEQAPTIFRQ